MNGNLNPTVRLDRADSVQVAARGRIAVHARLDIDIGVDLAW